MSYEPTIKRLPNFLISWNSRNLLGENGTPIGSIALGRDVTQRKRMEEELLKTQKLESIGTLAGGIAHDLNNLLLGVIGNISLARIYENAVDKDRRLAEAEQVRITKVSSRDGRIYYPSSHDL